MLTLRPHTAFPVAERIGIAIEHNPSSSSCETNAYPWRRTFRISPEAARTGFLLSPLLLDPDTFGRLFAAGGVEGGIDPQTEVRDLAIIQSGLAQRFYEHSIGVRMYKVNMRRRVEARKMKA